LYLRLQKECNIMKYNSTQLSDIIKNRRSIKPESFSGDEVSREDILLILHNARWAPTHGMTQPWFFKVFRGDGIRKLSEFQSEKYKEITSKEKFNVKIYDKLKERPHLASAVILICMRRQKSEKIPEVEEIEAVACAVQNMFLTATAMGVAAYWGSGGLTYTDEMKEFLGLDTNDKCLGFFYLGTPKGEWPKGERKPVNDYVEWMED